MKKEKVKFDNVQIITLPYFPFAEKAKLEIKTLDFISNSIIKIEKEKRRQLGVAKASKKFNFCQSDTIIGIDISLFFDKEVTYLECLTNTIYLYPFICFNNSIEKSRLMTLRLHRVLFDKGYILPCLPRLNPVDSLYTGARYGSDLLKLIRGEIKTLELSGLKGYNNYYDLNDFLLRFPNILKDGDHLEYNLEISWLGIENQKLMDLLSYLFNNNIDNFSLTEMCQTFEVNEKEFRRYANNSMLFDPSDGDTQIFRFTREKIVPAIKVSLLQNFENKVYECSVIDTTYTDYEDFGGTFREYHELGKLFGPRDTFSIKLITDLKNVLSNVEFDRIILIDNGVEDNLRILLSEILSKPVSRIINNAGHPQLYPFDDYNFYEKVLLVIDICNKGRLLQSVINFISNEHKSEIAAIYSFIINAEINLLKIKGAYEREKDFIFKYYIEKPLHDVSDISKVRQIKRRQFASNERYLFFWDSINRLASVEKNYLASGSLSGEFFTGIKETKSIYLQNIQLNEDADKHITPHSDLSYFVKDLVEKHGFSGCILNNTPSSKVFSKILSRINSNINLKFITFSKPDEECRKFYLDQSSLLIYDDGINAGQAILRFLKYLESENDLIRNNNVSVFVLFSRFDVLRGNEYITAKFRDKLNKILNNRLYIYYESHLPFYFLVMDSIEDQRLELKLKNI